MEVGRALEKKEWSGENGMVKGWVRGSPGLDELGSCKKQVPLKMELVPL
jgi:hypothetical protein